MKKNMGTILIGMVVIILAGICIVGILDNMVFQDYESVSYFDKVETNNGYILVKHERTQLDNSDYAYYDVVFQPTQRQSACSGIIIDR